MTELKPQESERMKEEFTIKELKEFRKDYANSLTKIFQSNEDNEIVKWTLDKAFAEFIFSMLRLLNGKFEVKE